MTFSLSHFQTRLSVIIYSVFYEFVFSQDRFAYILSENLFSIFAPVPQETSNRAQLPNEERNWLQREHEHDKSV